MNCVLNEVVISIIIPHYNSFRSLKKLLDSIPDRDIFQVIVVDDMSEDEKELDDLKRAYNNRSNVEFYRNNKVKGAGSCRNIGLSYAKGMWLLFADADDYFSDNAFESFMKYKDSMADIIYFGLTSIDLSTGLISNRHDRNTNLLQYYLRHKNEEADAFIRYNWGEPFAKMIRTNLVKANNIAFDEIIVANDVMFSIKVATKADKIDCCKEIVYVITKSAGSLTQKKTMERSLIRLDTEIRAIKYMQENLSKKQIKLLGNCGIYHIIAGYKMYGIRYAKQVIDIFINNKIPLFKMRIIKLYWIEYKNRIFGKCI